MSYAEIKVLQIGENRNHSYITKEVATEMSKTLRGAPIVGYYKKDQEDFADHGDRMVIDDEGIKFECLTKPYGFVSPDAKVWFQKFDDYDEFGNATTREYLMTTGYLWTEQFPECKEIIDEGKGQSMELQEKTLEGQKEKNNKTGIDFFIINDATFSKLCILGDDVEPCFEGASVAKSFTKVDENFKKTLYSMMQDLKQYYTLGGEQAMEENKQAVENENTAVTQPEETGTQEFKCDPKEDEEKKKYELLESKYTSLENDYNELNGKYQLLEEKYTASENNYNELNTKYQELVAFKAQIEDAKKDQLIESFYMLSDEDKKDVIENKSKYSYDDIEAKLSIICVRKKVSFTQETETKEEKNPSVTFNLNDVEEDSVPAFINELRKTKKN